MTPPALPSPNEVPRTILVLGPTAGGKTALSVELALRVPGGGECVSADSMQVYRGMDIGTAKPSAEERARVRHLGLDLIAPDQAFSAAEFRALAEAAPNPKILCGGTTFYYRAWRQGVVEAPAGDAALRAELEALPDLWAELNRVDPVLAARLHPNDRVRLVRGLEVWRLTGTALSALHAADPKVQRPAEVVWVDREDLYEVIDRRVEQMVAAGYLDEVARLLAAGFGPQHKPMQTLGYRHLAAHLAGRLSLAEAIRQTQADTREFARKQRSFLRSLRLQPSVGEAAARAVEAAAARAFGADRVG